MSWLDPSDLTLIVSWKFGHIIQEAADKSIVFYISAAALAASAVLWMLVPDRGGPRRSGSRPIGGAH